MSSTCSLKVYMPIDSPDNSQLVRLSIRSLDKWHQNIAQHCPFVSPWSDSNSTQGSDSGGAGADAGKQQVPERSLLIEEMREQRCVHTSPLADGVWASELSTYRLKGWDLLHRVITDGLTSTDASRVPPCDPDQRVYILFVEETETGKLVVPKAVNIGICPRNILMMRLDQVEKRGWRDVVWVGKKGQVLKYMMDKKVCIETMVWG